MIVELNLLKTNSLFSTYGRELVRKRVDVTENTVISSIVEFLGENSDVLEQVTKNGNFVESIVRMTDLTIDKLQSLRYLLAERGVDLTVWAVAEKEGNLEGVPSDAVEYNVIDTTNVFGSFIPFATKITVEREDMKISSIYDRIKTMYTLFDGDPFSRVTDPLGNDIEVMKEQEEILGIVPESLTMHANTILEFVGKKLYAITN
jgi:hypothetical protein